MDQFISTDIELWLKNLPTNRSPGSDGFTGKFYEKFREELTCIFLRLLQKWKRKEHSQAHSMRALSLWYQNQTKTTHTKNEGKKKKHKKQTNITNEDRCKNPQQNTQQTKSSIILKGSYTMIKWDLFQGCKHLSTSTNQCDILYYKKI